MAAVTTLIEMTAERGGAAALDGSQHFQVKSVQPGAVSSDEVSASTANDIGHLEGRPVHLLVVLSEKGG